LIENTKLTARISPISITLSGREPARGLVTRSATRRRQVVDLLQRELITDMHIASELHLSCPEIASFSSCVYSNFILSPYKGDLDKIRVHGIYHRSRDGWAVGSGVGVQRLAAANIAHHTVITSEYKQQADTLQSHLSSTRRIIVFVNEKALIQEHDMHVFTMGLSDSNSPSV